MYAPSLSAGAADGTLSHCQLQGSAAGAAAKLVYVWLSSPFPKAGDTLDLH